MFLKQSQKTQFNTLIMEELIMPFWNKRLSPKTILGKRGLKKKST